MQRRGGRHQGPGAAFFSIVIIGVGALFLLQNLGVVYVREVWQFWPVILIALGISKLAENNLPSGIVLTAIGGVFLANSLGYINGGLWQFLWPLLLIGWGLALLLKAIGVPVCGPFPQTFAGSTSASSTSTSSTSASSGSATSFAENTLDIHVAFSAVERRIYSQEFAGGEIHVAFGAAEIDLRHATTNREEIFLEVHAAFGGIELMVPETWTVVLRGSAAFGVFEDKTHPVRAGVGEKSPRLILSGGSAFGGVTVKN
jgi:hypothetical protein